MSPARNATLDDEALRAHVLDRITARSRDDGGLAEPIDHAAMATLLCAFERSAAPILPPIPPRTTTRWSLFARIFSAR